MNRILKEPLVHFLLLGGLLFALYSFLNKEEENPEAYTILISQSDVDRLEKAYQKNWNILPDSTTLATIIDEEVNAEILYREALRMNLDHNDEIIRRRLKQKYEFLVKDLVSLEEASSETLHSFYEEHPQLYQSPKTISFSQIYFSPDKRRTPDKDALQLYEQLKKQPDKKAFNKYGDSFHLPSYFTKKDKEATRQAFGKQFADALFELTNRGWTVPIASGYGQHLVHIESVTASELQPFEAVRKKVAQDWKQQQQAFYNERLYKNLRGQYKIEYDY